MEKLCFPLLITVFQLGFIKLQFHIENHRLRSKYIFQGMYVDRAIQIRPLIDGNLSGYRWEELKVS